MVCEKKSFSTRVLLLNRGKNANFPEMNGFYVKNVMNVKRNLLKQLDPFVQES